MAGSIRYKTNESCRVSVWIFAILLTILPFDSYLGEILPFPLTIGLMVIYMLARIVDLYHYNLLKLKPTPILLYIAYGMILSIATFIEAGATYNILLFYTAIPFFLLAMLGDYTKREYTLLIKTAPYSAILFIIFNLRHIVISGGEIYMGIKDICDPNYLLTGMVIVTAMLMTLFFYEKNKLKKLFYLSLVFSILLLGILIGTRGGLLACGFTFFVAICFGAKRPIRNLIWLCLLALFAFIVAMPVLSPDILERFSLKNMFSSGGSGRTTIWANYWDIYKDGNLVNILFGYGRDIPPLLYDIEHGLAYYSHNLYVKTLLEGGLVGSAIMITLFIWASRKLWLARNGMVLSALFGFLLGSMFLDMDNMRVFWLLLVFVMINIKGYRFVMWRGNYGLFDYNTNLQCRKVSKRKYLKRTEPDQVTV